jgi:ribose transport system permease protein
MTATARLAPAPRTDEVPARATPSVARRWASSTAAWIFAVDIVLMIVFSILSNGHDFASWLNAESLMQDISEAMFLSLGLAIMMGATIIDLSLGANLVLSSVAGALVLKAMGAQSPTGQITGHVGAVLVALLTCLFVGTLFGVVNGLIITVLKVNSLIATLGTLGIGTGLGFVLLDGNDIYGLPASMQTGFAQLDVLRVPLPLVIGLVLALVFGLGLKYTSFGMRTLAIGSNRTAADRAGIRIGPHIVRLTALAGLTAGMAGFIDISRFGSTSINGHTLDSLNAVTAVVLGGTALFGGKVSIAGALWGTLLASILLDGLVVLNVQSFYQQIATGAILVIAVSLGEARALRSAK